MELLVGFGVGIVLVVLYSGMAVACKSESDKVAMAAALKHAEKREKRLAAFVAQIQGGRHV